MNSLVWFTLVLVAKLRKNLNCSLSRVSQSECIDPGDQYSVPKDAAYKICYNIMFVQQHKSINILTKGFKIKSPQSRSFIHQCSSLNLQSIGKIGIDFGVRVSEQFM